MAFVRAKKAAPYRDRSATEARRWDRRYGPQGPREGGRRDTYYQLVESYREGGKVRQRVLAHLGSDPTLDEAIDHAERYAATLRHIEEGYRTGQRRVFRSRSRTRKEGRVAYADEWGAKAAKLEARAAALRAVRERLAGSD